MERPDLSVGVNPKPKTPEWMLRLPTMKLCPKCGNKRCPHAEDAKWQCTNSNATGQIPVLAEEATKQAQLAALRQRLLDIAAGATAGAFDFCVSVDGWRRFRHAVATVIDNAPDLPDSLRHDMDTEPELVAAWLWEKGVLA